MQVRRYIARTIIDSLMLDFPQETREILKILNTIIVCVRARFSSIALCIDKFRSLALDETSDIQGTLPPAF